MVEAEESGRWLEVLDPSRSQARTSMLGTYSCLLTMEVARIGRRGHSNLQRRPIFPSILPEVSFRTCQVYVPDCVVSSSDIQDTKNDESSHVSAYRKIDFNARYPKQATNRSLQTVNVAYREEKQACKAQKMDCQQRATTEDINHKSLSGQREKM